jgi:hypothetical protein
VRSPRVATPWSAGRARRRAEYSAWMGSAAWLEHRRAWAGRWAGAHGTGPVCQVCLAPWSLRHGDLHHRSYARLGHEAGTDLVPLLPSLPRPAPPGARALHGMAAPGP